MPKRDKPMFDSDSDTRNRILETAARLFALKSFKAVTLKEIAKAVGIKIASIYYYYEDKNALIEDILARFGEIYKKYQQRLNEANARAESLEDVMDNLFNRSHQENMNPLARLGMSMTLKEQHNHESAYSHAFTLFYEGGIGNVQAGFDRLIEKKIIPPSDTKTLATLFMFCVMSGNEVHMHEYAETDNTQIDTAKTAEGLRKLLTAALAQGILNDADERD